MRKFLFLIIAALAVCSACTTQPATEEVVAACAREYYDQLVKGNYEAFVDGTFREDSIPPSYREQLIANAKMFMAQQKAEHQGIHAIETNGAKVDMAHHVANVFLTLTYADSTREEIVVPMVCHDKVWYMR